VGDPFEDVPLEKLAVVIMAQLARRDIWIVDVEVAELSKKTISFKESKGGIILKNKKFSFDNPTSVEIITQEVQDEVHLTSQSSQAFNAHAQHPHNTIKNQVSISSSVSRRPIKRVDFLPEPAHMNEIRAFKLTPEKEYPVYEKKSLPNGGEQYLVVDDSNREQWVSDKYFVPSNIVLVGDSELNFSEKPRQDTGKLLWDNSSFDPQMPNLRRR
jgi:hypothetical protein